MGEVEPVHPLRVVVARAASDHRRRRLLDAVRIHVRLQRRVHGAASARGLGQRDEGGEVLAAGVVQLRAAVDLADDDVDDAALEPLAHVKPCDEAIHQSVMSMSSVDSIFLTPSS